MIELEEKKLTKEELLELHKDKTTFIDDDHPAWIAYLKAEEDRKAGKLLSSRQIVEMIKNGEYDFED
jgi:5-methylcytosine-specific restriction endonuclease McrBC GTP-binding regulatory subunit McrB